MCGCKPRPWDLDLHPTSKGQNTRNRDIKEQKGYRSAHGIKTNIDISTPTWHGAHKHINLSIGMTRDLKKHKSKYKHGKEHIGM